MNAFVKLWKDANSPLDYMISFWISGLAVLAIGGWFTLVVNFIINPTQFNGVTWGLIDYIP